MVIIFGYSDYNTLGTIRCLGEKQTSFILLLVSKTKYPFVLSSRFVKNYQIVESETEGIEYLLKMKSNYKDYVIIPTSDKTESALDNNYNVLKNNYIFPHSNTQGFVNVLMDKLTQVKYAKKVGLHIPQSFNYRKGEDLPVNLCFPCIVKQLNSTQGKKESINECQNEYELKQAINKAELTTDFLIQQYIKKEYDLLLIGCRFFNGETWIPGIFKKERWVSNGGDGSFGILSTSIEKYFKELDKIEHLLEEMNYYGLFSVEFGVESNIPYFYEINLRNDGTSHYFHQLGIYLPYIYSLDARGNLDKSLLNLETKECYFIDEFSDIRNIKLSNLKISKWKQDIKRSSAFKFYDKHDLKPFIFIFPKRLLATLYKMWL